MLEFINYDWKPYQDLRRNSKMKYQQIDNLYATGLAEGTDGLEYTFVPTKKMQELEIEILNMYDQIIVENHETQVCDEIFYTTKIEGAKTTKKRTMELHNGAKVDHNNYFSEMMVLGGFHATKFLNLHSNKIDEKILRKMWEILTDGACDNSDIAGDLYRIGNVSVGSHMGLNYTLLKPAMDNWITFYNSKDMDDHPFIKAAILHFTFEFIHPFCDGNGRAGRLLMLNYLISRGYDKYKAISISKEIAETANGYYNAFDLSDNPYTDCTPFIEYMLNVFANTEFDLLQELDKEIEKMKSTLYPDL